MRIKYLFFSSLFVHRLSDLGFFFSFFICIDSGFRMNYFIIILDCLLSTM